jgi:hypothetical protein
MCDRELTFVLTLQLGAAYGNPELPWLQNVWRLRISPSHSDPQTCQ